MTFPAQDITETFSRVKVSDLKRGLCCLLAEELRSVLEAGLDVAVELVHFILFYSILELSARSVRGGIDL